MLSTCYLNNLNNYYTKIKVLISKYFLVVIFVLIAIISAIILWDYLNNRLDFINRGPTGNAGQGIGANINPTPNPLPQGPQGPNLRGLIPNNNDNDLKRSPASMNLSFPASEGSWDLTNIGS